MVPRCGPSDRQESSVAHALAARQRPRPARLPHLRPPGATLLQDASEQRANSALFSIPARMILYLSVPYTRTRLRLSTSSRYLVASTKLYLLLRAAL